MSDLYNDDPSFPPSQHRLHNLDITFPLKPAVEQFGGELPAGAQLVRAYCYRKHETHLVRGDGEVPSPTRMLRLVFRCIEGVPTRTLAFLIAPGQIAVVQREGLNFLDAVVDGETGNPWSLWSTPVPETTS